MHTLLSNKAKEHIVESNYTTYDILQPDFTNNPFLTKRDKEKLETIRKSFNSWSVERMKLGTVVSSTWIGEHLVRLSNYEKQEKVRVVSLSTKNDIIAIDTIFIGSLNSSVAHPREIYKKAIEHSAARIIITHNHPSGDIEPSQADLSFTRRVVDAGEVIGIECVDHIITGDTYLSLREQGLM